MSVNWEKFQERLGNALDKSERLGRGINPIRRNHYKETWRRRYQITKARRKPARAICSPRARFDNTVRMRHNIYDKGSVHKSDVAKFAPQHLCQATAKNTIGKDRRGNI